MLSGIEICCPYQFFYSVNLRLAHFSSYVIYDILLLLGNFFLIWKFK